MSDTTTERSQSLNGGGAANSTTPNLPPSGSTPQPTTPGNAPKGTESDLINGLFGKTAKPNEKPGKPGERDTAASTTSVPDVPESEASGVAPQQDGQQSTDTAQDTNLPPEERWRRDFQSERDKRFALEAQVAREKAEREVYEEQQRISQMDRVEQQAYQQFQSQVKPLEQQAWDLHNRAETARQEGDIDLANYFEATKVQMVNAVNMQYNQFNQWATLNRQQVYTQKQTAQEKQLSRTLEKAGLTLEELKAHDPKLDTRNYFQVLEVATTVRANKEAAKHKADVEKARQEAKEAREKWRTDSPASIPDRSLSYNGKSSGNRNGPGGATADIAEGLKMGSKKRAS